MSNIQKLAVLTSVNISKWSAEIVDRDVTAEVTAAKGAVKKGAKVTKSLFPGSTLLKEISDAADGARKANRNQTMPFAHGVFLLPIKNLDRHQSVMETHKDNFDALVEDFLGKYENHRAAQQAKLGELFRASDYPPVQAVRDKFKFRVSYQVIPDGNQWDGMFDSVELEERMKREAEADLRQQFEDAQQHLWDRMHDVLERVATSCAAYGTVVDPVTGKEKKTGVFRNTMLDNVKELVDVLPFLNVTDDDRIAKHCEEMRTKIAAYSCDQLRENEALCKKVGQDANDILAAMSAYGAAS